MRNVYALNAADSFLKLVFFQKTKKFSVFYGTLTVITQLTTAHHLSLSRTTWFRSTFSYPTSIRSVLILSSHHRLDLPSCLLSSDSDECFDNAIGPETCRMLVMMTRVLCKMLAEPVCPENSPSESNVLQQTQTHNWTMVTTVHVVLIPLAQCSSCCNATSVSDHFSRTKH